jgi:hypothetical protein
MKMIMLVGYFAGSFGLVGWFCFMTRRAWKQIQFQDMQYRLRESPLLSFWRSSDEGTIDE